MDKANGDAPFIPLYGTAVPGAGLGRLAGLPAAGLRLHRGQAAPEPGGISPGSPRLSMEPAGRRAVVGMQAIPLSEKEFGVLYLLYTHPDVPITKEQIYEAVWCAPSNHCLHAVENTVFQIRRRLRPHAGGHDFIRTVAGLGYQFNPG